MNRNVTIQPIQPQQSAEAKRVILSVAHNIYKWPSSLEEVIARFDASGELRDVDDHQTHYFERGGIFLAVMDKDKLVGTGAIRPVDAETAELKRLWLLETYHGQGIGYQLVQLLFAFAQEKGFKKVRLLTDGIQHRAIAFYEQVGFHRIPCETDDPEDVCMEIEFL